MKDFKQVAEIFLIFLIVPSKEYKVVLSKQNIKVNKIMSIKAPKALFNGRRKVK
jgi:hypothetical protein